MSDENTNDANATVQADAKQSAVQNGEQNIEQNPDVNQNEPTQSAVQNPEQENANSPDRILRGQIEAMLFVSSEPVSTSKLANMLDISVGEADTILSELASEYEDEERGIQLREVAGGWRLYTHPAYHDVIEKYVLSWDTQKLSQASLETLAVIAYNQPATRALVSSIRGVGSDAIVASLVEKGLVKEAGRENSPGQPILYATTRTFLEKFGLKSVKDLPPLEDFAANEETRQMILERLSASSANVLIDEDGSDADDNLTFEFDNADDEYAE